MLSGGTVRKNCGKKRFPTLHIKPERSGILHWNIPLLGIVDCSI